MPPGTSGYVGLMEKSLRGSISKIHVRIPQKKVGLLDVDSQVFDLRSGFIDHQQGSFPLYMTSKPSRTSANRTGSRIGPVRPCVPSTATESMRSDQPVIMIPRMISSFIMTDTYFQHNKHSLACDHAVIRPCIAMSASVRSSSDSTSMIEPSVPTEIFR